MHISQGQWIKFIMHVLYVDDILLVNNNIRLLHETKKFLYKTFEMKDVDDLAIVLSIEINSFLNNSI